MSLRDPVPILFIPSVVLPGRLGKLKSSSAEKGLIQDLVKNRKNKQDGLPLYVGLIPSLSGSLALKPGMVGTYARFISYSRELDTNEYELSFKAEKRMIVERKASLSSAYAMAYIRLHDDPIESFDNLMKLLERRNMSSAVVNYLYHNLNKRLNFDVTIEQMADNLEFSFEDKLAILEALSLSERLFTFVHLLDKYVAAAKLPIPRRALMHMTVFKPNQLSSNRAKPVRFISSPFGDNTQRDAGLGDKIETAKMPPAVKKTAMVDFARLQSMSSHSSEYSVLQNYLETLVSLPWSKSSLDEIDVNKAKEELDRDHYGISKIKRRILEYLAVRQLKKSQLKGPILCFVGPPGVGKTSFGRSIASILGRKFHRICLGGVAEASDIRGSRRTYVASMPGRIISALKQCGTNNPVILLDEIDKMSDGRLHGNPIAALLEVLDPEQNSEFTDHYIGLPFDLSQVIFVATANDMKTIPLPLLDRMEILMLSGYTEEEKYHIAKNFIIPKLLVDHGLGSEQVVIPEETLRFVVTSYSRESGVRKLERNLAALLRDAALKVAAFGSQDTKSQNTPIPLLIDEETVKAVLGGPGYQKSTDRQWTEGGVAGVVVGLAYTGMGGEILPIETTKLVPGSGKLILTGKLGKVISESAKIALDWFKNAAFKYQIYDDLRGTDVHIHLPSGAVSKDGPSAGIALATSLVSLFSGLAPLPNLAVTGELTLQGHVLPVGGLKDKLTAAHRAGITKVILPKKCESSMDDLPQHLLDSIEIILVDRMSEVIEYAFNGALTDNQTMMSKL